MPTTDPVGANLSALTAASGNGVVGQAATSALGGMDSDAFLQLMVAQLRYQNPLSPSDPGDMMLQTAQFTQVETLQELARLQRRDLGLQEAVMAAGLVGDTVAAVGPDGAPVEGVVDAVRYTTLGPVLQLEGGTEVALGDVTTIRRTPVATAGVPTPA